MNTIGQPFSRADGRRKVTGGARYTADLALGGTALRRDRSQHDRKRPDDIDRDERR